MIYFDSGQKVIHRLYGRGIRMARERKKNRGMCTGLVVGNKGKIVHGGINPALEKGDCKIISFDDSSNAPEVLEFANALANIFITVDKSYSH